MNKIPKGYKLTEVGVIPEDWDVDKIKNFALIATGAKNTQDKINGGTYPFFVRSQIVERINSYSFDGEAVLTAGDGVGTGKVFHYINGKFDFHQRVYKISHFNEKISGYYFYLYFSNNFYDRLSQMTAKSSVDSIRMEMIAEMDVPIPKIEEQSAIAEALSDVDALISSLDELIAKKRNIKQGAMQELLTGKRRLPGFSKSNKYKQTEIGLIPEDWDINALGTFGKFTKGKGIKKDEVVSEGFPCIRYGEIYTTHSDYIRKFYSFITENIANLSQILRKGDLLFAGSGETSEEIGKCVAFLEEYTAYAGGDIVIFSPRSGNSKFFGYLMNHSIIVRQKSQMGQGDAVVHISATNLALLKIPLPNSESEQTAIAAVLSDMDAEIEQLEQKRDKYKQVKQGMMQELLTGKTRLI